MLAKIQIHFIIQNGLHVIGSFSTVSTTGGGHGKIRMERSCSYNNSQQ